MSGPRVLLAGGGTGGHLYPALNLADAIRRLEASAECHFLGGRRGLEARVLPDSGYPYRLLPLEPLYRSRPWRNWRLMRSAPAVLLGVRSVFRSFRPDVVVGTGGYVSGPAVAWAAWRGIPTALQEQNAHPGLVTRLLAGRVDQIHLGYPEAADALRTRAEIFTFGNPVAVRAPRGEAFAWPAGDVLLVVGGSQGARALNRRLLDDLELRAADGGSADSWPDALHVVWVAGRDHADEVSARASALPWSDRIRVVPFIDDLGSQLESVTLALSRAGAMLVAELCAAGCPSVLVPLPTAAAGHQSVNARALADAGAAVAREQAELGPGDLWSTCVSILADQARLSDMAVAARSRGRPEAAEAIAGALLALTRSGG